MKTEEFLNGRLPCSQLERELVDLSKSKDKDIDMLKAKIKRLDRMHYLSHGAKIK